MKHFETTLSSNVVRRAPNGNAPVRDGDSVSGVRWATFRGGGSEERVGVVQGQEILALPPGTTLLDLLGDTGEKLRDAGQRALAGTDEVFPLEAVALLPPV